MRNQQQQQNTSVCRFGGLEWVGVGGGNADFSVRMGRWRWRECRVKNLEWVGVGGENADLRVGVGRRRRRECRFKSLEWVRVGGENADLSVGVGRLELSEDGQILLFLNFSKILFFNFILHVILFVSYFLIQALHSKINTSNNFKIYFYSNPKTVVGAPTLTIQHSHASASTIHDIPSPSSPLLHSHSATQALHQSIPDLATQQSHTSGASQASTSPALLPPGPTSFLKIT